MRGAGRALFAAILLVVAGTLNVIYGIAAISNADVAVSRLPLVSSADRALLTGWNSTTVDEGSAATIVSFSAANRFNARSTSATSCPVTAPRSPGSTSSRTR